MPDKKQLEQKKLEQLNKLTEVGTDIEEVTRLNAASGLSYNDVKAFLVKAGEVQTVDEAPQEATERKYEIDSRNFEDK